MLRFLGQKATARDLAELVTDEFAQAYWGQSGEDAVLQRYFANKRNGFYVDVGGHHPRRFSNTRRFHRYLGWRGINIDASLSAINQFKKERPNDINVRALIGSSTGMVPFTEVAGGAMSTADPTRRAILAKEDRKIVSETILQPKALSDILYKHMPKDVAIDLLNVDIEGLDIQALESNDWTKYKPNIISVEDFEFVNGDSKIKRYLSSVGYVCVSHCYDTSIYKNLSFET